MAPDVTIMWFKFLPSNKNLSQTGGVLAIIHTIGHIINFYTLRNDLRCLWLGTSNK